MRRTLEGGFELDDDPDRVDLDAVHEFLSTQAYWAKGRSREAVERLVRAAARVVGLYRDGHQVGFARAVELEPTSSYLADVYVLPAFRGRGLGVELVREAVEGSPVADGTWFLKTKDAHSLYERFGFTAPSKRLLERPRRS